jgi:hypothetical protein
MPVFWNCHDLAIRLAHIIVEPSMEVINSLKRLMILLRRACNKEVNWHSAAGKLCVGGWGALALGGLASIPPLAAVGTGVFMIGWSTGFFGGFVSDSKEKARYQFMLKLEERFPQLRSLHHWIAQHSIICFLLTPSFILPLCLHILHVHLLVCWS